MPTIASTLTSLAAAAGVAAASFVGLATDNAYDEGALTSLSQPLVAENAKSIFARADRDGDAALSVDEFAALTIVNAELAHLNGFIAVEEAGVAKTVALPIATGAALAPTEHARIDAVARHRFYGFSGDDGLIDEAEFIQFHKSEFNTADMNKSGVLNGRELNFYARRQAFLPADA